MEFGLVLISTILVVPFDIKIVPLNVGSFKLYFYLYRNSQQRFKEFALNPRRLEAWDIFNNVNTARSLATLADGLHTFCIQGYT